MQLEKELLKVNLIPRMYLFYHIRPEYYKRGFRVASFNTLDELSDVILKSAIDFAVFIFKEI